jgi:signal peptidase I
MVKRVIGLPGDTVRVIDGRLQITDADGNVVPIAYEPLPRGPYHAEPTTAIRTDPRTGRTIGEPKTVPVEFLLECFGGPEGDPHFVQLLQPSQGWTPSGHQYRTVPAEGAASSRITLADRDGRKHDEYLMIGDNRDNSLDSRYYWQAYDRAADSGPVFVRGEHITGKAKFIAVSFEGGSFFRPAWGRFFRSFDGAARDAAD